MDLGIDRKVALVGGSSAGIGLGCARALASEGADVVLCSRSQERLDATRAELQPIARGRIEAVVADLSTADGARTAVAKATAACGSVDILVCNSGGPPVGPFAAFDDDAWQAAFESVTLATIRLVREVIPLMRERGWGRIIGIQSSSVKQPVDNLVLSNGIRPGVAGLFKALVPELARDGITVNLVLPGLIRTERILGGLRARAEQANITVDDQLQRVGNNIPLGRLGEPDEIGALVAFLASTQAAYMTGGVLQVDGGSIRSNV